MFKRKSPFLWSMLVAVLATLSPLSVTPARAEGHGPGNGGNAVLVDGKLYLLDLVEAGVQKNPYIQNINDFRSCQDNECTVRKFNSSEGRFLARAYSYFREKKFDFETTRLLTEKLLSLNTLVRDELLLAIVLYQWRLTDLPLEEVKGIKSPLDLSQTTVYQLAYRRDNAILINRALWEQLDPANRVALIIHEVVYAMLRPMPNGDGTFTQESWDARLITGDLFTEATAHARLRSYARNGIPMLSIFEEKGTDWRFEFAQEVITSWSGQGNIGMFADLMFSGGVDVLAEGALPAEKKSMFRTAGAWALPGVDPDFERNRHEACSELDRHGGRGVIRNFYMRARLTFVDYKTDGGYTKAIAVKYVQKMVGTGYGTDEDGESKVDPAQKKVAYASAVECREKFATDATEVARAIDGYVDNKDWDKP